MSAGKDGPRDWDKELADIDKLIGATPATAPPPPGKGGPPNRATGGGGGGGAGGGGAGGGRLAALRYSTTFTWIRLILALGLGLGMTQWPYTHGCGLPLYGYLAAVGAVIIASTWSMVSSWHSRSGFPHFLSIVLMFWGAALAAREVLPRVGYAKEQATWECLAEPAAHQAVQPPVVPAPSLVAPVDSARLPVNTPPSQSQKQPATAPATSQPTSKRP